MATVLITGAARGLGLALARCYAEAGWHVHATCRDPGKAHALRTIDGRVTIHRLDVRDQTAYPPLADRLSEEPLDVAIANAGVGGPRDRIESLDVPGWFEAFHVNCIAPLMLAGSFRRHLARSGGGRMIAISSILGSIADNRSGGLYAYRCSKAALNMAIRSLAWELRDDGILCAVLHPGWVRTDMGGEAAPLSADDAARSLKQVIEQLRPEQTGGFFDYRGRPIPW